MTYSNLSTSLFEISNVAEFELLSLLRTAQRDHAHVPVPGVGQGKMYLLYYLYCSSSSCVLCEGFKTSHVPGRKILVD